MFVYNIFTQETFLSCTCQLFKRKTSLSTYHQNSGLIIKMLKKHLNIPTRPKITDEQMLPKIKGTKINQFSFDVWKKISVVQKGKYTKKMKMITKTLNRSEFQKCIITSVAMSFVSPANSRSKGISKRTFQTTTFKYIQILRKIISTDPKTKSSPRTGAKFK